MTTVKAKLRKSRINGKVGKLFIQIIHNREIKTITTPFKLLPSEWNEQEQKAILNNQQEERSLELRTIEKELNKTLTTIHSIISKLSDRNHYTTSEIVELYTGRNAQRMLSHFMNRSIKELRDKGKDSTAYKYSVTLRQFLHYRNGEDISFDQLTVKHIKQFEEYLKDRKVVMNTVSFYMRILRAVYNKAIMAGLAPERNLFRDVYTGIARTVKRAVDEKTIQRLKAAELPAKLSFARDMFLFSFYTRGMSYVDMANLRKCDSASGVLTYKRRKTGQVLSIRIEPCISEIIKRYAKFCEKEHNLLPITFKDGKIVRYATAIRSYNDHLKIISNLLLITPILTSYVSRHTWASLARRKGINLSIISEGMGHTSDKTTQIYLNSLDQNILDEANKMVIYSNKKAR